MKKLLITTRLFMLYFLCPFVASAQKDYPHDANYYQTFPEKITGRFYFSQKYNHLNFPTSTNAPDLEYKSNAKLNMGVGVSWHNISLNVFYGFQFLNKKDIAKGKTKGLDIQMHVYPRKWAIDIIGAFPKGFYLDPKGFAAPNANSYYYRPDIKESLAGLSAYKVPNKERFSYRAAIIQTEWQKKSAGSVLYGGEAFYGSIKGDSALVPKAIQNNYPQAGINKINFFRLGPGIGYAYTLVMGGHFFIMGSMIANLDICFTSEQGAVKKNKTAVSPGTVFKTAFGYNSATWNVSANWLGNGLWFKGNTTTKDYFWPIGKYVLVISRKFTVKKKA
jgi:hypothetical protein